MDRRNFLRRTSLALAGGLVVGPQVMEMYEQASLRDDLLDYMARMTHKKVFALGAMRDDTEYVLSFTKHGRTLPAGDYRMSGPIVIEKGGVVIGSKFSYPDGYNGVYAKWPDEHGTLAASTFYCRSDNIGDMRWFGVGPIQTYRIPDARV